MHDEQAPRRLIAAALFSSHSTALLPSPYEQLVAQQYITGVLTIQQAVALLEEHARGQGTYYLRALPKVHVPRQI